MTEIEFKALAAQGYNRIPLLAEALADQDTPLGLYLKLTDPADRDLLVDFGGVTFCDSSGLRALILAARRLQAAGHRLRVIDVSPRVARVFTVTGLQDLIDPQTSSTGTG